MQLAGRDDSETQTLLERTVWVLDNNVAAPDGGFGTRYPWFALIGVNPFPTPTDTASTVISTAYQYNYNSNAPADLLNGVAHLNSLVAYVYGYQDQQQIDLPVDAQGNPTCGSDTCTVKDGDRVVAYVVRDGNTTFVTFTTDELPLTRLIRDVFGDQLADLTGPLLKVIVDSAYYGGNPIPDDPSVYRPARLLPSPGELLATAAKIPAAIQQGLASLNPPSESRKTTAVTATEASVTDEEPGTGSEEELEPDEESGPLTNVVRSSVKAEPGTVGEAEPAEDTDGDAAEQVSAAEPEPETDTPDTDTSAESGGNADTADADAAA
jgi:hypothetical protein